MRNSFSNKQEIWTKISQKMKLKTLQTWLKRHLIKQRGNRTIYNLMRLPHRSKSVYLWTVLFNTLSEPHLMFQLNKLHSLNYNNNKTNRYWKTLIHNLNKESRPLIRLSLKIAWTTMITSIWYRYKKVVASTRKPNLTTATIYRTRPAIPKSL